MSEFTRTFTPTLRQNSSTKLTTAQVDANFSGLADAANAASRTYNASSQASMLALLPVPRGGDHCWRSDRKADYVFLGGDATSIGNWYTAELPVTSVFGRLGDVKAQAGDYSVEQVSGAMASADLSASSGSSLVGFIQSGTGTVPRTVQNKLRDQVSAEDFGAVGDGQADDTAAVISACIASGNVLRLPSDSRYQVSNIPITVDTTIFGGVFVASGALQRCFTVSNGACLTLHDCTLIGGRPALDCNQTNIGVQVDNGTIKLNNCSVSKFAYVGVNLASGGLITKQSSILGGDISECGTGINTADYEHLQILGVNIHSNGLNVAKTAWSGSFGPGTGCGIYGRLANTAVIGCQIYDNAIGLFLDGQGGGNPDHNKICDNSILHNWAAGLIIRGNTSYEVVSNNNILSNIRHAEAPTVIYSPIGRSVDMSLEDVVGIIFTGNSVGPGDPENANVPIFGHARCKYSHNQFVYVPPVEIRHPMLGSAAHDIYGYEKNGDNLFHDNTVRNENTAGLKPVVLSDSIRTVVSRTVESAGPSLSGMTGNVGNGGGSLLDDVVNLVSFSNSWASISGSSASWFCRRNSNVVSIYIYATCPSNPNSVVTTLPIGFRPTATVQLNAAVGNTLAHTYATIYADGTITFNQATTGQPALLNGEFLI